ncbi:hypothetical protein TRIUR3_02024 [Triticum urartu]|uniref:Uncharacterized protein n=1 Tax=Triticum urartu TaxID=4572 RepID=M8A5S5_TRIUA|nr:hypothetical protein TRIUR3_02024 [Triticum urartu]
MAPTKVRDFLRTLDYFYKQLCGLFYNTLLKTFWPNRDIFNADPKMDMVFVRGLRPTTDTIREPNGPRGQNTWVVRTCGSADSGPSGFLHGVRTHT